ncbi:PucR family transcriptional regulator [Cohnella sp. AR92]|uniref:PucR family transcriptional regulator n=1 Tax=Cohnella sp. AR92 TaxID=648716 RepID=UPI000F8CB7CE|nr:PucR family transcriptional regulator [Cohnella sp. AR92]RUS45211.1 PucR family transcriptional regulator [Cohnella sp. AR92]
MKLEDLLNTPTLKNVRIAAGEAGLSRTVESVNMMDSPDVLNYLRPNELTLTTAYAIKDEPGILTKLIAEMAARGGSGLGIKTKRYLERIPEEAKQAADRLQFPLLELPVDFSLSEAVQQLLGRILEFRTDELRHALDSHRKFSNIILEGNSLQHMIQALSDLLELPLLLVQRNGDPLAQSDRLSPKMYERLLALGHSRIPRPPDADRMSSGEVGDPALAPYSRLTSYPIYTDQPQAYLLILSEDNPMSAFSHLTIEQAVNVISFELMKRQAVKERSRRYKYDFLSDVVEGLLASDTDIANRGRSYGLLANQTYRCATIKQDLAEKEMPTTRRQQPDKEHLYERVKQEAKACGMTFILFVKQDGLVMLLPCEEDGGRSGKQEPLELALQRMLEQIWQSGGISLSIGIGNPADRLTKLAESYQESQEALLAGYQSRKQRFVQYYHVKELSDLLRMLPPDDISEFIQDTFGELNRVEDSEQTELKRTLRVYYENHCHIADTAKQLYLHRNTVIYRLEKCEKLTGRPLRSIADSLRFRVAFQMEEIRRR